MLVQPVSAVRVPGCVCVRDCVPPGQEGGGEGGAEDGRGLEEGTLALYCTCTCGAILNIRIGGDGCMGRLHGARGATALCCCPHKLPLLSTASTPAAAYVRAGGRGSNAWVQVTKTKGAHEADVRLHNAQVRGPGAYVCLRTPRR